MNKEQALQLLNIYAKAWVTQDSDLILSVFTPDATYNDPAEPEISVGHEGIKAYWLRKVVAGQKDISFNLLNVWVEGDSVIAEWDAEFADLKRNVKVSMRTVAIFTARDSKFASLREYWTSKKTPL